MLQVVAFLCFLKDLLNAVQRFVKGLLRRNIVRTDRIVCFFKLTLAHCYATTFVHWVIPGTKLLKRTPVINVCEYGHFRADRLSLVCLVLLESQQSAVIFRYVSLRCLHSRNFKQLERRMQGINLFRVQHVNGLIHRHPVYEMVTSIILTIID